MSPTTPQQPTSPQNPPLPQNPAIAARGAELGRAAASPRTRVALLLVVALVGGAGLSLARPVKRPPPLPIPPGTPTVNLSLRVTPSVKATVMWGRQLLGETPLSLPFPRDSGPVDVVVRAPGYVTTHTRLNTFANDSVTVKLVPEAERRTVFGYKRELPPPPAPDGGVPPQVGAPPAPPPPPAPALTPAPAPPAR